MTSSPTPPIELLGSGSRFEGPGVEVPEDALRALESICDVITEGPDVAEASRDWWPLALHWALAGNVPKLADVVVRPTSTDEVRALIAFDPTLGEPLVPGQPYLRAEAVYAARHEMATTLDDVLVRRTRAHLFDRSATLAVAADVADLLAPELGWDAAETERQVARYRALCDAEEAAARASGAAPHPVTQQTAAPEIAGAHDDQLANATD